MTPRWMVAAVFVGAALVTAALFAPGGGDAAATISCLDDDAPCQTVSMNRTVASCAEWYPDQGRDALTCNYTTDVGGVTLVADAANHVRAPFADAAVKTEYLRVETTEQWDLEPFPDGSWLVTQQGGMVKRVQDGDSRTIGDIVVLEREMAGLMGAAVDPSFTDNRFVYLYYTYAFNDSVVLNRQERERHFVHSRISRFRLVDGRLRNETVLLSAIPGTVIHTGGRLEVGPDNKLYATVGDVQPNLTARFDSLPGSVLRLNRNGTIPASNPRGEPGLFARPPQPAGSRLGAGDGCAVRLRARPVAAGRDQPHRARRGLRVACRVVQ